jgi:hypothetical protein
MDGIDAENARTIKHLREFYGLGDGIVLSVQTQRPVLDLSEDPAEVLEPKERGKRRAAIRSKYKNAMYRWLVEERERLKGIVLHEESKHCAGLAFEVL